jgi:hypothetical protein
MERQETQAFSKIGEEVKAKSASLDGEAFQLKITEYNDLCTTCNNAPKCLSRKNHIRPVYFCENYDDFIPQKPAEKKIRTMSKNVTKDEVNTFKGLCVNCRHRNTCAFPKPEGGVWHCEEYE